MGVDHRRPDILVAEKLLDRPDVVARHEQMGREGMAKGVAADLFGKSTVANRGIDRFSHHRFVKVVPAD